MTSALEHRNRTRKERAAAILTSYAAHVAEADGSLADLLADLMHRCHLEGTSFAAALVEAAVLFRRERWDEDCGHATAHPLLRIDWNGAVHALTAENPGGGKVTTGRRRGRASSSDAYHAPMTEGNSRTARRAKRRTEPWPRLHVLAGAQNRVLGFLNEAAREHFRARGVESINVGLDPADPLTVVLRGDLAGRRIDPRGYVNVTPLRGHLEPPADIVLRRKGAALVGRISAGAETSQALADAAALVVDADECLDAAHGVLQYADHPVAGDVAALIDSIRPRLRQAADDLVRVERDVRGQRSRKKRA